MKMMPIKYCVSHPYMSGNGDLILDLAIRPKDEAPDGYLY